MTSMMIYTIEMDIWFESHSPDSSIQIMLRGNFTDFVQYTVRVSLRNTLSQIKPQRLASHRCVQWEETNLEEGPAGINTTKFPLIIGQVLDSIHLAYSTWLPLLPLNSRFWESHLKLYTKESDESVIVECPEVLFILIGA